MALPATGSIIARWSADDITPQTDNTNLTGWTDSVGSFAATQGTSGQQPKYRTNRMGGKPSVQFLGGQTLNVGRPASIISAYNARTVSVFIVFKTASASTYGAMALFGGHFIYADATNVGNYNAPASQGKTIPFSAQTGFSSFGATAVTPDPTGGGTGIQRYFVNGGGVTQNDTWIAQDDGSGNYAIGGDAGINFMFDGEIFDIVVWNTEITPTDMLQAQMWACDKYSQAYPWAASPHFTVFDGDSITVGSGSTAVAESYPYKAAQTLGLSYGQWSNIATTGITMSAMNTQAAANIDAIYALIGKPIKVAAFEWYNQRAASPTPRNTSLTYLSGRRTSNVKVCFGTSTDTSATTDANRGDYNSYFDANHTTATMDSYVAIHSDANIGVETANVDFPANFYDGIHLTDAGYTTLASLFVTGLNAITFSISGAAAVTLGSATLSAAGTLPIVGAGSPTLGAATLSAAGEIAATAISGAAAITLSAASMVGAGALPIASVAAVTLDASTTSAAGSLAIVGAAPGITLDAATVSAAGVSVSAISGAATITLDAATSASVAALRIAAAAPVQLVGMAATSSVTLRISATAAVTLDSATLSSAGAAGTVTAAVAAITLDAASASAAGTLRISAGAADTLADAALGSTATLAIVGVSAVTLDAATTAASATNNLIGSATIQLSACTIVATGVASSAVSATADITLGALQGAGHGWSRVLSAAPSGRVVQARGKSRSSITSTRQ